MAFHLLSFESLEYLTYSRLGLDHICEIVCKITKINLNTQIIMKKKVLKSLKLENFEVKLVRVRYSDGNVFYRVYWKNDIYFYVYTDVRLADLRFTRLCLLLLS